MLISDFMNTLPVDSMRKNKCIDRRTDGRTDRQRDRETGRHDKANSRCSQLYKRPPKL